MQFSFVASLQVTILPLFSYLLVEVPRPGRQGDVVFGRLGSSNDIDWFRFTTPSEKTDVSIHVAAYALGSPLDTRLVRYDSEGTQLQVMTHGDMAGDPDPVMRFSSDQAQEHYVVVRSASYEGLAYWYTAWIEIGSEN